MVGKGDGQVFVAEFPRKQMQTDSVRRLGIVAPRLAEGVPTDNIIAARPAIYVVPSED